MILPIVGYGSPVLRKRAEEIKPDHSGLQDLIDNMFETMHNARGVGLAAPQIGLSLRLFIVDGSPMEDMREEGEESLEDFKRVFINAEVIEEEGDEWPFEEGCLSIPDIREDVYRPDRITLQYFDRNFNPQKETFTGIKARIVQHEYDHIEGVLFTDHISPLRRRMLKPRLNRIQKGSIQADYPMKFAQPVR